MKVAFGHFDGVHRGHQALLAHRPDRVYVQDPITSRVLTTDEERDALIRQYAGPDCQILHVDKRLDHTGFSHVVIGSQHPALSLFQDQGSDIELVEPVVYNGHIITASLIAQALEEGLVEEAEAMLGHPYIFNGEVVYGRQLGRTVGMPTVNLKVASNKLIPKLGVYGSITIVDGKRYVGVTSIGPRPTVDDLPTVTIETFLLHFNQELYGQFISMELKTYIRPITKFENLEAVRRKVDDDARYVVEMGLL